MLKGKKILLGVSGSIAAYKAAHFTRLLIKQEAEVKVIREKDRLNVVVEDNGKGFDAGLLENNKGAGLANVRSRVDYLKGQLDIHAEPGKGTLVNIEFNI